MDVSRKKSYCSLQRSGYSTISVSLGVVVNACGNCAGGVTNGSHIDTLWYSGTNPSNPYDLLPYGSTPLSSLRIFGPTGRGYACMDFVSIQTTVPQRPAL